MRRSRLCALLTAAAAAAALMVTAPAAEASSTPCVDAPDNTNCNGVSPFQEDSAGYLCANRSAYAVPYGSPDDAWYVDNHLVEYEIQLWYSPTCGTNWAEVIATGNGTSGSVSFSAKVRRYAGADGGYLMEHAATYTRNNITYQQIYSPMVYSPDNLAQACLSLPPFTGTPDQISCTGEH
jgi:Protein of unknown function (DUF2690)